MQLAALRLSFTQMEQEQMLVGKLIFPAFHLVRMCSLILCQPTLQLPTKVVGITLISARANPLICLVKEIIPRITYITIRVMELLLLNGTMVTDKPAQAKMSPIHMLMVEHMMSTLQFLMSMVVLL